MMISKALSAIGIDTDQGFSMHHLRSVFREYWMIASLKQEWSHLEKIKISTVSENNFFTLLSSGEVWAWGKFSKYEYSWKNLAEKTDDGIRERTRKAGEIVSLINAIPRNTKYLAVIRSLDHRVEFLLATHKPESEYSDELYLWIQDFLKSGRERQLRQEVRQSL